MVTIFEQPLPPGMIYPCTKEEIEQRLSELPQDDLKGIQAVGLVRTTRKSNRNGVYYYPPRASICIYAWFPELQFKLPQTMNRGQIELYFAPELSYGLVVEQKGARFICRWNYADLNIFILSHVLAHEIGHHVLATQGRYDGIRSKPPKSVAEQFAEAYAVRHARRR